MRPSRKLKLEIVNDTCRMRRKRSLARRTGRRSMDGVPDSEHPLRGRSGVPVLVLLRARKHAPAAFQIGFTRLQRLIDAADQANVSSTLRTCIRFPTLCGARSAGHPFVRACYDRDITTATVRTARFSTIRRALCAIHLHDTTAGTTSTLRLRHDRLAGRNGAHHKSAYAGHFVELGGLPECLWRSICCRKRRRRQADRSGKRRKQIVFCIHCSVLRVFYGRRNCTVKAYYVPNRKGNGSGWKSIRLSSS
jgi:hypothetical protein